MKYEEPYLTPELRRKQQIEERETEGLVHLYTKGHPGASLQRTKDALADFQRKGKEQRGIYRLNWERAYSTETGHCSTGGSPQYERAPVGGILHDIRKVRPAEEEVRIVTRGPEGKLLPQKDLEYIIREQEKRIQQLEERIRRLEK